jgi:hypothetical protein
MFAECCLQFKLEFAEYTPVEIWEGQNIFADPCQCNAIDLMSALDYVAGQLCLYGRHYEALPVLAFLEYCAFHATRDARMAVKARLLRVEVLCEVGHMAAAGRLLVDVAQGKRIPGVSNSNERTPLSPDQVRNPPQKTFQNATFCCQRRLVPLDMDL